MRNEVRKSGFEIVNNHAVEGCICITPKLNEKWQDTENRNRLLDIIYTTEQEETLMGLSLHFLVIGRK